MKTNLNREKDSIYPNQYFIQGESRGEAPTKIIHQPIISRDTYLERSLSKFTPIAVFLAFFTLIGGGYFLFKNLFIAQKNDSPTLASLPVLESTKFWISIC